VIDISQAQNMNSADVKAEILVLLRIVTQIVYGRGQQLKDV